MKFAMAWTIPSEFSQSAISRFLETGAGPPAGVTMLGRWHGLDGAHGFLIAESADPKAIYSWVTQWSDLLSFTVTPLLEDAEAAAVFQDLRKR